MSQTTYTKADVRQMFPVQIKDLWINSLSGTVDGTHTVDMIIGTDGHACKGLYTMRSSGETFFFEGNDVKHKLQLVELTKEGKTSGYIYGKYDGENFEGLWTNKSKNFSLPMKLSFVNTFDDYQPTKCKQQQWNRIFAGKINDKDIKLQLIKDQNNIVCINFEDGLIKKEVLACKGTRVEVLELRFKESVLSSKSIVLDTSNLERISIISLDENGYEISTTLKLDAFLDFECFEYADYHSKLLCNRPLSTNKKFDAWIEMKFTDWIDGNVEQLKKIKHTEIATKDRWIQSVDGWVEIDLFLSDIISGTIYLQSTLKLETVKIPFIFDLKNSKEIVIQDIFDNKFDSKAYLSKIILEKKDELVCKPEMRKWLTSQAFEHVTLNDSGICFRTDFNIIYGEKEIHIPYSILEPNLKNRNLLKEILIK